MNEHIATEQEKLSVIDASVELWAFSKKHTFPVEGTPEFFEYVQLMDNLETKLTRAYPQISRNLLSKDNGIVKGDVK